MQDFDDLGFYLKRGLNIRATSYILFVDSHVDKKAGVLADGSHGQYIFLKLFFSLNDHYNLQKRQIANIL